MTGLYYEQFKIDMEFKHSLTRTVTEMDNIMFCAMTPNPPPLHLDEEFGKNGLRPRNVCANFFCAGAKRRCRAESPTRR